jgi:hypothetical protein
VALVVAIQAGGEDATNWAARRDMRLSMSPSWGTWGLQGLVARSTRWKLTMAMVICSGVWVGLCLWLPVCCLLSVVLIEALVNKQIKALQWKSMEVVNPVMALGL